MRSTRLWGALSLFCLAFASSTASAQDCPISYGTVDDSKPNKVYLYFPTADDFTFPEFGVAGLTTRPARRFDALDFPSYTGTTAALRDEVTRVVRNTYCEFNVQVRQITTFPPPTTFARRNTIGVGGDARGPCGGETWGLAQAVDTNDATAVDFGRVWAGSYQLCAGNPGGQLHGVNSTLQRWARSIGGTAAHEAGHNYGISHGAGTVLAPGEDPLIHHVMASGGNFSYANRAGYRRHFSNNEYSILAANVGLSIQTMWNWDLVNPNSATGFKLQMDFLSLQPSLILSWSYNGPQSPWINPTVTGPLGTQTFKGVVYNRYRIEWATPQTWAGGAPGQVGGGMPFHIGATFSGVNFSAPDAIIITDTRLLNASNGVLPLHPRLIGFDGGTLDSAGDSLTLRAFNFGDTRVTVRNVVVRELPRVASLDSLIPGGRLVDMEGEPLQPWEGGERRMDDIQVLDKGGEIEISLAKLSQAAHVTQRITPSDCERLDRMIGPDVSTCRDGVLTDLFPSTTVLVTLNVVDEDATYWDPAKKEFVRGPLTSQVFYQMAGRPRRELREVQPRP